MSVINRLYRKVLHFICIKFGTIIPDRTYLKMLTRIRLNKKLNLNNPSTYNEKLQWLKIYDRNSEYTNLVDKYSVREHISNTIGEEYLIPLLGVYETFDEINFEKLPNKFVLKCTHDSGGVYICTDKESINLSELKVKFEKLLKRNYFYSKREWPYKNIKPRIICEEYMVDESGKELKDYKIFCFNGKPKIVQVDFDRFEDHKRNIYTKEWELLPFSIQYPMSSEVRIRKPERLNEMLNLAEELSKDYPHVRVDFYSIRGQIYFGELTFYHESGFGVFSPDKYDKVLGSWLTLPS